VKAAGWRTGMARMVFDAVRATDVLLERPEVDPDRVGTIGHSLGGKEALYHAAFDERIRAAISCEGGVGLRLSNWDDDHYLGKQINAPSFARDNHEVMSLVAPRALLVIGGESADGAQSWPFVEACLPVWRLYGAEDRLGLLRHADGHNFPPPGPNRELVWRWLDAQMNGK
jgi:pimeloyl-ACP methyl ester carboxylesterase